MQAGPRDSPLASPLALATKLVNDLVEAAGKRQSARTIARYGRIDLLCIGELGDIELDRRGAELPGAIACRRGLVALGGSVVTTRIMAGRSGSISTTSPTGALAASPDDARAGFDGDVLILLDDSRH